VSASTDDIFLEPSSGEARPGDGFQFAVQSRGEQAYWFGYDYALERQAPDGWVDVTAEEGFKMARVGVEPGGRFEQWAEIPRRALPGTYRIVKKVFPAGSDRGRVLSCRLTVPERAR
jgi:hypothetical protein